MPQLQEIKMWRVELTVCILSYAGRVVSGIKSGSNFKPRALASTNAKCKARAKGNGVKRRVVERGERHTWIREGVRLIALFQRHLLDDLSGSVDQGVGSLQENYENEAWSSVEDCMHTVMSFVQGRFSYLVCEGEGDEVHARWLALSLIFIPFLLLNKSFVYYPRKSARAWYIPVAIKHKRGGTRWSSW
jgi:hypothetical protein